MKEVLSWNPKNITTVDLTVTTAYVPMSVDTAIDEYELTRAPVEIPKTFSQPAATTSSSSIFNPRTA